MITISALSACKRCPRLARTRTQVVPWLKPTENPRVRVMFVGEAPNKVEDVKGRPFSAPQRDFPPAIPFLFFAFQLNIKNAHLSTA